jgi:glycosyl transferase family 25
MRKTLFRQRRFPIRKRLKRRFTVTSFSRTNRGNPKQKPRTVLSQSLQKRRSRLPITNYGNRLAGPKGVSFTGPPLQLNENLKWPSQIKAAFAISMRILRWNGMKARLGKWAPHVKLWSATNGAGINIDEYKAIGKLDQNATLRRGEIGCYDSHMRIWKYIIDHHIPLTLILEDDANLRYDRHSEFQLARASQEAQQVKGWDLLYIGHNGQNTDKNEHVTESLMRPIGFKGLFGYLLTENGAKVCLAHALPFKLPVDVLVANLHDSKKLNALGLKSRLFYVVPVVSDTVGIK